MFIQKFKSVNETNSQIQFNFPETMQGGRN